MTRLLLSAFVCGPNHGSEPGLGWAWAIHAASYFDEVWVVTRGSGREAIEAHAMRAPLPPNLRFIYVDEIGARAPVVFRRLLNGKVGLYTAALAWQWAAYRRIATQYRGLGFAAVHHVTFAGIRTPSFMGRLGIPFVFGPVGGGERAPWRLRRDFGLRAQLSDAARDVWNQMIRFDPFMRQTFRRADRIYVTSPQTAALVPACWSGKVSVQPAIAADDVACSTIPEVGTARDNLVILYLGRLLAWKGMGHGIRAFAAFAASRPDTRLVIVGDGPAGPRWRRLAESLGIADKVIWRPRVPQNEVPELFQNSDVVLFPSLHDSGGMVVLEAMQHGRPVVCLDLGGPGVFVDNTCGRVVTTKNVTAKQLVTRIAAALQELTEPALRQRLGACAKDRVQAWNWAEKIELLTGRSTYRPEADRVHQRVLELNAE